MKFTQILLAAPFLAGALAAPQAIVEGDDKAVCESQEGKKFMKGTCVTDLNCKNGKVMKMNKDGDVKCVKKQSKKQNNNGKNKGGNKKGGNKKGGNKKGGNKKGGNKKNNNKKNKNDKKEEQKKKEEEKKQEKKDNMEEKKADREAWAATHDCVTGVDFEVLGDGKKVPFACAATCPDATPYRCHKTQQCHDCTATTLNEFAEFYKLTTVSKTDKDGIETTMDKCNKAKIGDITVDRAAELKQLMEEKMTKEKEDWAADNDCEADGVEVVGAGNLSRPYACMDECPADMPFRCMETMQCHDCTDATLGEKAGMMELVEGECKPVKKDDKKNDDNKKKDNNKKGGNKKGDNKKGGNKGGNKDGNKGGNKDKNNDNSMAGNKGENDKPNKGGNKGGNPGGKKGAAY